MAKNAASAYLGGAMKRIGLALLITSFWLLVSAFFTSLSAQQEDSITLLTYYPAPYGIYKQFKVSHDGAADDFVVDANGRIGIGTATGYGTSSLTGKLEIYNGDTDHVLRAYGGPIVNNQNVLEIGQAYLGFPPNLPGVSIKFVVRESGDVGIGTDNPESGLHLHKRETTAHGKNACITIENTAAGGRKWYLRAGADGTSTPSGGFSIADDDAYRIAIKSDGKVGIGTTDPQYKLHVWNGEAEIYINRNSTGPVLRIRNQTADVSSIYFYHGDAGNLYHAVSSFGNTGNDNEDQLDFYSRDRDSDGVGVVLGFLLQLGHWL